jgi:hypothetical protein
MLLRRMGSFCGNLRVLDLVVILVVLIIEPRCNDKRMLYHYSTSSVKNLDMSTLFTPSRSRPWKRVQLLWTLQVST